MVRNLKVSSKFSDNKCLGAISVNKIKILSELLKVVYDKSNLKGIEEPFFANMFTIYSLL